MSSIFNVKKSCHDNIFFATIKALINNKKQMDGNDDGLKLKLVSSSLMLGKRKLCQCRETST